MGTTPLISLKSDRTHHPSRGDAGRLGGPKSAVLAIVSGRVNARLRALVTQGKDEGFCGPGGAAEAFAVRILGPSVMGCFCAPDASG
jgi:hypothetical protein